MADPYYVDKDRGHDCLLRCKDCQALVTYQTITKTGGCGKCGNKRFTEIKTLTETEMEAIAKGEIDFPDREKFMAEFHAVAEA